MRSIRLIPVIAVSLCASAQAQVTVQQPVVRSTAVGTTVSVPDRGRVVLGGVSSAESFRNSYSPFRTGTSRGYGLSGGSISVTATIIDLQAMDEALLGSAPAGTSARIPRPTVSAAPSHPERSATAALPPAEKAAQFEQLARNAESNGKPGVARLHWQMAARYGSTVARQRLTTLADRN